jgi:large subunit ribosomal protein L25
MADLEFNVETRTTGKHWSRGLRRDKSVPAIVYGPKVKNANISVLESDVVKYDKQKYDNAIFVLKSKDSQLNGLKVLKKSIDIHPVSRRPVHLDFFALDLTQTVRVFVEIRFEGKSIGVKEGGILNTVKREVEVECLPTQIPQFLSLDITNLGILESIHASELKTPEGVKLITLPTETLCTVVVVEEEVAAPVAVAAAVEGAAPAADGAPAAPGAAAPAAGGKAPAAAAKADDKKK